MAHPRDRRRNLVHHRVPEGSIASSRKQYALKDGTVRHASPQFRFQTKGGRGKQVCKYVPPRAVARVMNFFEYCSVDGKGTPVPIRGSFSYAVTDGTSRRQRVS